jgi:hypothetical protein
MNQSALARALGLSRQAVSQFKQQGMPVHSLQAAQAWRASRVNPARSKEALAPPPLALAAEPGGETFGAALTRKMIADANLAEMRYEREREEHISVAAIRQTLAREYLQIEAALAQFVQRVGPMVTNISDAAEVQSLLDVEVHAFLEREARR